MINKQFNRRRSPRHCFIIFPLVIFCFIEACNPGAMETHDAQPLQVTWTPIGQAYANSSINVSVYRCEGLISLPGGARVVSYFDPSGTPSLAYMDDKNRVIRRLSITPQLDSTLLNDGHCSINLGLSSDGFIHVLYGAHCTRPLYAKFPISRIFAEAAEPISAALAPLTITYPQFIHHGNELHLWYRRDPEEAIYHLPYNSNKHSFSWPGSQVIPADGESTDAPYPYLDKAGSPTSNWLITWMYRLPMTMTQGRVVNEGIYAAISNDGGQTWVPQGGSIYSSLLQRQTAFRLLDLPLDRGLMNQGNSFCETNGNCFTTLFMKDKNNLYQIHLLTHGKNAPSLEVVSQNTQSFNLEGAGTLVLPLSRAEVVASPQFIHIIYRLQDHIVISTRRRTNYSIWKHRTVQAPQGLGAWEPILHREAWEREGRLRLFVQFARQGPKDTAEIGNPAQAYLLEITKEALER